MASFLSVIPPFLLSVLIFSGAVVARGDVLELGDADFDYLAAEHETMLVKFYAPW
jgi:protein disulfide isomerase family A protein 3